MGITPPATGGAMAAAPGGAGGAASLCIGVDLRFVFGWAMFVMCDLGLVMNLVLAFVSM
jgi:hypothetical protein